MLSYDLNSLNETQLKPVLDVEGAVLVTAGAGSGKTRLLTHRIAYLIGEKGVMPYNILAITFTNKAANEMKERLFAMLGEDGGLWVSTFHAMCVKILRRSITKLGYKSNFSIYGEQEKEQCVKRLVKAEELQEDGIVKTVIRHISDAKSNGKSPEEYRRLYGYVQNIDTICRVYDGYERELKTNNALDYDDLLIKALEVLKRDEETREYYQNKFRYIHVDEFQDTNEIQYNLVRVLSLKHGNVLAVGDEDQSIYGWRGAKAGNVRQFIEDFHAKVYKLEQNYRSTKSILALANNVIRHNSSRIEKTLWTENGSGDPPELYCAQSDGDEAQFVIKTIANLVNFKGYSLSDFAILMRINALSRNFEEKLLSYNVPHRVYGGFKFYERKEVKDVLAYLRFAVNHDDGEALLRVINFPKRGIGPGAVQQLLNYSAVSGTALYDVIASIDKNDELPVSLIKKIQPFQTVVNCLENAASDPAANPADMLRYIVKLTALYDLYASEGDDGENRTRNVEELISGAESYAAANPEAVLSDYLYNVSLYSDTDEMSDKNNCVNLATIHSVKGLEFKVVFVVGLEEGVFPDSRKSEGECEEERRLMYVAATRAEERLFLSYAKSRFRYGERTAALPSRFIKEAGFDVPKRDPYAATVYGYSGGGEGYGSSRTGGYGNSGGYSTPNRASAPRPASPSPYAVRPAAEPKPVAGIDEGSVRAGSKVRHKKFGVGTVLSIDRDSGDACAEVEFPGVGKLLLMLKYAPLELADDE